MPVFRIGQLPVAGIDTLWDRKHGKSNGLIQVPAVFDARFLMRPVSRIAGVREFAELLVSWLAAHGSGVSVGVRAWKFRLMHQCKLKLMTELSATHRRHVLSAILVTWYPPSAVKQAAVTRCAQHVASAIEALKATTLRMCVWGILYESCPGP